MNGSNLTYAQITTISQNLQNYSKDMQNVLDEITGLVGRIGNEDIWGGTAAEDVKSKFNTLNAKFADFYKAVTDESAHLAQVVENYQKADSQLMQ